MRLPGLCVLILGACRPPATDTASDPDTDPDTVLPPPFDLVATPDDGRVHLAWGAPEAAAGFIVERSGTPGGPYTEIGRALLPRFTDTGLTNGDTWSYVVVAANAAGESPRSEEVTVTVGP